LPFALPIVVIFTISLDQQFLQQCIGRLIEGSGRGAAWVRLAVAIGCSPSYLFDFSRHWLAIATFWLGVVFAVPQVFWLKRHKAYWDLVRQKERDNRAAKSKEAND